jgi:NADPH:quinone reductase-like Zn-dependent oxidoreductase
LPATQRNGSVVAMKAILLRRPGGPDALEYTDVPTPVPGDDEVLVKADTIGVSMPEVLVRRGAYAWMVSCTASTAHGGSRRRWPC